MAEIYLCEQPFRKHSLSGLPAELYDEILFRSCFALLYNDLTSYNWFSVPAARTSPRSLIVEFGECVSNAYMSAKLTAGALGNAKLGSHGIGVPEWP